MVAVRPTRIVAPVVPLLVIVIAIVAGSCLRAEVPTAISKVVTSYLDSMQHGEYDQAYKLLSPADHDRIGHDEWVEASARRTGTPGQEMPQEMLPIILLSMGDAVMGETVVKGDEASTLVEIKADLPLKLCLVKQGEDWLVDLQRTDQTQVASMARKLVDSVKGKGMGNLGGPETMGMMMGMWSGVMSSLMTSTGALQRYVQSNEVKSATVEGDRAEVEIAQHAALKKHAYFKRAAGTWVFDVERTFRPEGEGEKAGPAGPRGGALQAQCLSNLKQIGMAMMVYAADHDEQLPAANKWCDELKPYLKNENVLQCPVAPDLECGYAMNFKLSKVKLAEIAHPEQVVLEFESSLGGRNGNDDGKSWVQPPRHNKGNAVLYADGHVVMTMQKPDCRWQRIARPKGPPNPPPMPEPAGAPAPKKP